MERRRSCHINGLVLVLLGLDALVDALVKGLAESDSGKGALAERIAVVLRARLQGKVHAHH